MPWRYADPVQICSLNDLVDYVEDGDWKEYLSEIMEEDDAQVPHLELAADYFHKDNVSGGPPYSIQLTKGPSIDSLFLNEPNETTFINYLRICMENCGFSRIKNTEYKNDYQSFFDKVKPRLKKDMNQPGNIDLCLDILLGVSAGDAVGVPVEFKSREEVQKSPVADMMGYGTYNKPPGTFSDDSSLTFCLAEALTLGYDLNEIARNFINWRYNNYWTASNEVFDVGMTTQLAIDRLLKGTRPDLAGDFEASSNGNGSLMRILPLLLLTKDKPIGERYQLSKQVSSITHGHIRSVIACFYYLEFALGLQAGLDKFDIYRKLQQTIPDFLKALSININEIGLFNRLLVDRIDLISESQIYSSGYVLHTLEAGIWCLLTTDNYRDAVLNAINLGNDTDTTAAVTGGLAGILYGHDTIAENWLKQLARRFDIEDLAVRLAKRYQ